MLKKIKKLPKNNQSGFTLVEMIIYLGLMSVVITILTNMFVTILESQLDSAANTDLIQESQYILARLQHDVNRAETLVVPAAPGISGDELVLATETGQLEFNVEEGIFQLTLEEKTYPLHSSKLETTAFSVATHGNDSGAPTIELTITLRDKATQKQSQYSATYGLRQ